MNFLSLIEAKRDGQVFTTEQIRQIVSNYTAGNIPDYQMASLLMAIYFQGLNTKETSALTLAMRDSGDVLRFPNDPRPLVDKHSTGGVGDKVSLPLAPLLACLGFRVPMISGRGLGITGGTLDKLESISGLSTALPVEKIVSIVQTVGCVICGQTAQMVPADKGLYALRDVTGTVPSIPLITASILSKKLAENLDALVLDVKFGAAAFMPTIDKADELAQAMVKLGIECGVNTRALVTNMDRPLGRAAGNWLEVKESVDCLEGKGPSDLEELVIAFAATLLLQTKKAIHLKEARAQAVACLASGRPRQKWDEMIVAQGGDLEVFNRKLAREHTAPVVVELSAEVDGFLAKVNPRVIGEVVRDLGGGRFTKETIINHDVGIDMLLPAGEDVSFDTVLCRVHATDKAQAETALARLKSAFEFSELQPTLPPLIQKVVQM
ncbi:thymidine phosphorylase [Pedosphaera parvula]|uniref:thymidine phosphorylase n=1 Tax=Pedosphaera parvula (strain Ellin514) TaxID=320771 RepID=B9XSV2_PEDPL|nr:thymidine phosphorylase [Pedosphaera parvula]EEF57089.1 pyrimidine-nucleoside phosphorylase [Pedosphaera parvula Ellin514]